jgi:hypothetical protein
MLCSQPEIDGFDLDASIDGEVIDPKLTVEFEVARVHHDGARSGSRCVRFVDDANRDSSFG